ADRSLIESGIDSLLAFTLLQDIETEHGVTLQPGQVLSAVRPADLARVIVAARGSGNSESTTKIRPRSSDEELRPSALQRGLWLADQLQSNSSHAFNIVHALRIIGTLDKAALERAFQSLIARHDVLRSRFVDQNGELRTIVDERAPFHIDVVDLSQLDPPGREERLHAVLRARIDQPFDLS